jgi:hypothetical protein
LEKTITGLRLTRGGKTGAGAKDGVVKVGDDAEFEFRMLEERIDRLTLTEQP